MELPKEYKIKYTADTDQVVKALDDVQDLINQIESKLNSLKIKLTLVTESVDE